LSLFVLLFRFAFRLFQLPAAGISDEALKRVRFFVDTLDSMIRITLMDGSQLEIPREEAVELLPYRNVFQSKLLKDPVDGLVCHRGKLVPVLGPLPEFAGAKSVDKRAWLLLMKGCAQVVQGLPEFLEAQDTSNVLPFRSVSHDDNDALSELDELLKMA